MFLNNIKGNLILNNNIENLILIDNNNNIENIILIGNNDYFDDLITTEIKYQNKRGKKFIYAFLDEIGDELLLNNLNKNIPSREELERRMNIISSIQGRLALKIKLLSPTVLFGEVFDEITKNFCLTNK